MKTKVHILIILFVTFFSAELLACNCVEQRTVQEEIKNSDAVFVGTVISKEILYLNDSTIGDFKPFEMAIAKYKFIVENLYKGKITNDTVIIYTGIGGGDCGNKFETGEKYIVYGAIETYFGQSNINFKFPSGNNSFWTHICLRTTLYNEEEITEIEKFKKTITSQNDTILFIDPEILPIYKDGGELGLRNFVKENLRYPATGENVSGKVYVGFTIDTLGNVKDIEIKRGITKSTDEEAMRIVKLLKFIPGSLHGKPIEKRMIIPIDFSMNNDDKKE
jgi:TonB family protein